MTTIVRVQVEKLDLRDDATLGALAEFENATFGRRDGIPMMTVYVADGQEIADTVIEATRTLANKVPGARAVRVHPDLVAASKIAHRVGYSREAVRKWTQDDQSPFPMHVSMPTEDTRVWEWVDVVAWLYNAKGIDMREGLPSREDIDHINSCLAKVPDHTTHKWRSVESIERDIVVATATPQAARIVKMPKCTLRRAPAGRLS